ncbi:hypothetical protein K227x_11100 [Rubripirellula lacrimiformis]|uniref:Rhodanese-related sulfurtransferase n=1 Tax=Rubripirellula lacrimiformis TaxID=1930273 RepID=A0A517N6H9_9BACT|nr:immunity 53 family protein [Rubripirellula lacrimiformis]QDT02732.1 hypothetical protein K227x_11100 [Rubripirellula lacrimiformis]
MPDSLDRLQQWYQSHCNGQWEHSNGVSIETLDNPGWSLRIDLSGTEYSGRKLDRIDNGISSAKRTWTARWIENDQFCAAGGPSTLPSLIESFFEWADSQ